jgi:hypothetical protein
VLSGVKTELREKLHMRPRAFRRLMATARQGIVAESDFFQGIEDSLCVLKKKQIAALIHCYRIPETWNMDFVRFTHVIEQIDLLGAR